MAQFVAAIDRFVQASADAARWLALPLVAVLTPLVLQTSFLPPPLDVPDLGPPKL